MPCDAPVNGLSSICLLVVLHFLSEASPCLLIFSCVWMRLVNNPPFGWIQFLTPYNMFFYSICVTCFFLGGLGGMKHYRIYASPCAGLYDYYLVVSTPLKKYESQLGWWNSQYMESHKIHVPNHQPDYIEHPPSHHFFPTPRRLSTLRPSWGQDFIVAVRRIVQQGFGLFRGGLLAKLKLVKLVDMEKHHWNQWKTIGKPMENIGKPWKTYVKS